MSSESDCVSPPLNIEKCSLLLVDVAGTTTSIDFVKNTLFTFVADKAEAFLSAKWDEEAVKECITQIREGDQELDVASAVEAVKSLTEKNSPNQGLKTLQGLISKEGYEKGDLKAHVFGDVSEAFETWAKNKQIAVYSTGSVDSQKLLFAHTIAGDLSAHIFKYFDQSVGAKTEAESYKKIAEETKLPPEEIVFITDDVKEAAAAKAGGVHAVLIKRDGNPTLPEEESKEFAIISSFAELTLDKNSKRKIEEQANVEAPPSKFAKTEEKTTDNNTAEKVEEESMEVDSQMENTTKTAVEETNTATEETENLVKNAPEKTETETEEKMNEETASTDAEMKEIEKTESEAVVAPKPVTEAESVVEKTPEESEPVVKEAEVKVEQTTPATKEEKPVGEPQPEDTQKMDESKPVEKITVDEIPPPVEEVKAVVENIQPIVEEAEQKTTESEKTEDPKTLPSGETVNEKVEETPDVDEIAKEAVEETVMAEPKPEKAEADVEMAEEPKSETTKTEEKVEAEDAVTKNGEEEGETSVPKTEEKENKSVLANGVENGSKESEVDNTVDEKESETAEVTNEDVDNKDDDNEVKVKKLEESAESKTVSVEV